MRHSIFSAILLFQTLIAISCTTTVPTIPKQIDLLHKIPIQTTQVDGYQVAYLDIGHGPPVILLHGFGGAIWHWEHQQIALSGKYRVITIDMLGSGLSEKPAIAYTPKFLLLFLGHFMDNLGISRAILVGNSLGAGVAMGMAISYPDRVDKLILISGFPAKVLDNLSSPSYRRFVKYRPPLWIARVGSWMAGRWVTERILKEIIYNHDLITPIVIERSYRNRTDTGVLQPLYSIVDHLKEWEESFAQHIGGITQPSLILWGTQDGVFPPGVGHRLQQTLPHASIKEIPEAGHIPQWEKPDFVNPVILQFLAED